MRKLGANQKLKSGIFCVLESGICNGRIRNPAPGIRNPQRGIQNLILSWITLHGATRSEKSVRPILLIGKGRVGSGCTQVSLRGTVPTLHSPKICSYGFGPDY